MATFRYRAATPQGALATGQLEGVSQQEALEKLRRLGLTPIEAVETDDVISAVKINSAGRVSATRAIGELAVLLGAGLTLDRALAVVIENIEKPAVQAAFTQILSRVKEGVPLSRAMADQQGLFPPMASAMAEAGEANGRLDESLARLAHALERGDTLRKTVRAALVYPAVLMVIAISVILVMLLVVVPQFEGLFGDDIDKLPPMSRAVMSASHALKDYGWVMLLALVGAGVAVVQSLKRPSTRLAFDAFILGVPQIGPLVAKAQTAQFARVLGSLVDGGVPLPSALAISRRSLSNNHMAMAVGKVAAGLKEGGGLTGPLAAAGVFPRMALSFLRTGEETAQLGLMLGRLADVLDGDVRSSIDKMIALLTPLLTVVLGGVVALVIAAILSAILGFNDLALAS
jgi:general secretion pathway protein F